MWLSCTLAPNGPSQWGESPPCCLYQGQVCAYEHVCFCVCSAGGQPFGLRVYFVYMCAHGQSHVCAWKDPCDGATHFYVCIMYVVYPNKIDVYILYVLKLHKLSNTCITATEDVCEGPCVSLHHQRFWVCAAGVCAVCLTWYLALRFQRETNTWHSERSHASSSVRLFTGSGSACW